MPKKEFSDEILATLTPRQEKIIRMYQDGVDIEDIAKYFQIPFAHCQRQWEKACRRLNHPSRSHLPRYKNV